MHLKRLLARFSRPTRLSAPVPAASPDYEEVLQSNLFDAEYYLDRYPDIRVEGVDPLQHYLTSGWRESRNPNMLFDAKWYVSVHADVREEGGNPLLHYIRCGAEQMRDTSLAYLPTTFQDPHLTRGVHHLAAAALYMRKIARSQGRTTQELVTKFSPLRVLIIAELTIPQCRRYRVDQKCELLRSLGYDTTVLNWHDAAACEAALATHSLVLFYRIAAVETMVRCIAKAKALGLPTYWEVDDLIFDPNAYMANSSLKALPAHAQKAVLSGVPDYRDAMLACDEAIASTRTLARCMRDSGVARVHVVENALDAETLSAAEEALSARPTPDGYVRIVYGSGTHTHDEDFLQASAAIIAMLDKYPQVRLRIIGQLNLPPELGRFGDRIERFEVTSYARYLQLMAPCDIAIAPLEPTLFNDAKSNIKFIEAAMVALPSICSPRAEFRGIIEHGTNGLLADDFAGWVAGFEALILDHSLRNEMAARAKAVVLARYHPDHIAATQLAPIIEQFAAPSTGLRVLVANVHFEPRSFGGAAIVAEHMARHLNARPDTHVAVFTTAPPGTGEPFQVLRYSTGGIPVFAICVPESADPTADFDAERPAERFREVLRYTRPDVVHLHSTQGLGAQLLEACEQEGVPVVVTLHDAWWICGRQFMIRTNGEYCAQTRINLNACSACVPDAGLNVYRQYRLRDMLRRADLLLAPSEFFSALYAANDFPADRLRINRNGVRRPASFQRTASDKLRFGFVGGNAATKGAHLVRKVFAQLGRSDYELVIVDNTQSLGFSSISAADWPISGDLKILPAFEQDGIDAFYAQIDVLLFPTQWKESFGLSVREALIRDIWVIATDAGGVVEDMVDGENGDIIPLQDDGTHLTLAVKRALDNLEAMITHTNPYKADIVDHEQQAEELHEILSLVSQNAALRLHDEVGQALAAE